MSIESVMPSSHPLSFPSLPAFIKYWIQYGTCLASQVVLVVKNLPANAGDMRHGFHPWVRNIPWRRKQQPTPAFLPGKSHGQRKLPGYSPWGHRVRYGSTHTCTYQGLIFDIYKNLIYLISTQIYLLFY